MVVDAGDLMWRSKTLEQGRLAQQRVKGRLQLDAFVHSGIDAMVPGDADLALGLDWLGQQMRALDVPYVATNLSCEGLPMPTHRVVDVGGLRIGVLGVVGRELAGPCTFRAIVPAINQALNDAGEVDLVVVLSHQNGSADESMAAAVPAIDVVVNGHSKMHIAAPTPLGETAIQLAAGKRGKKLGIARIQISAGAKGFQIEGRTADLKRKLERAETRVTKTKDKLKLAKDTRSTSRLESRLRRLEGQAEEVRAALAGAGLETAGLKHAIENTLRPLSEDVDDHDKVSAMVQVAKPLIAAAAELSAPAPSEAATGGPFVGTAACSGCHSTQDAQWKGTRHAAAWATLERDGRAQDLDCWSCHVTGAHHAQGPQHPSQTAGLENVGCESCHGPGRAHVAAPSKSNIQRDPAVDVCTDCHDGIKDEGRFDHAKYRAKVEH
jgi:hypothetical protein